jgi:cell division protein FtsW
LEGGSFMQKLKIDIFLFMILICLIGYGISMNYSANSVLSLAETGTLNNYLYEHLAFIAIGFVAMLVVAKIKYSIARKIVWWINGIVLILLCCAFVPSIQVEVNGAIRWINLFGFTFQPSELAKITVIFTLCHMIDNAKRKGKLNNWRDKKEGLLPMFAYIGVYLFIVLLQRHLSATILLGIMFMTLLFIGGVKKRYLAGLSFFGFLLAIIGVLIEPYRLERITSFRHPEADPLGGGYQIIQSWYALGSGEMFGLGLGMSRQKFGWLPENHTDFIIAIIGEELGFFGVFVVILLFLAFLLAGLTIASKGKNTFEQLLVSGIVFWIIYQFMINLAVVGGLMPVTGMPLPFISFGGTSMVVLLIGIGLIFNITSKNK